MLSKIISKFYINSEYGDGSDHCDGIVFRKKTVAAI